MPCCCVAGWWDISRGSLFQGLTSFPWHLAQRWLWWDHGWGGWGFSNSTAGVNMTYVCGTCHDLLGGVGPMFQGCSTVGCSHQMWNPHFNLGYALATAGENSVLTKQPLQIWERPLPYGVEPIWSCPCVHVSNSSALDCFGTWVKQIDLKPWNFVYFWLLWSFT